MTDLFLRATRKKFRFASRAGDLTTEQLWDLPLTSKTGMDLNTVAKTVNAGLKAASEESFVTPVKDPQKGVLADKLEVVKAVIAVKLEEAAKAERKAVDAEKRRKLQEAIAAVEQKELTNASKDDLLKQLNALREDDAEEGS